MFELCRCCRYYTVFEYYIYYSISGTQDETFEKLTLNPVIVDPITHKTSKRKYPISRGTFREK